MMSAKSSYELVVIGAGISGLGFAHMAAKKGMRPLVLEASSHLGGCLHSEKIDLKAGSFWLELGTHTCFNSYGTLLQILDDLGQLEHFQSKEKLHYQLLSKGELKSIPSALSFLEIIRSVFKIFSLKKSDCSVEQYFGSIVGPTNFRNVVGPALDAVICQSSALFPADALFRKKPRNKEVERSFTGKGGVQAFVDAIASQAQLDIRHDCPVDSVERGDGGFVVKTASGECFETAKLVFAVGPDVVAGLLDEVLPGVAALAAEVSVAEIDTTSVVVEANTLSLPKLAGIIAAQDEFYSAVSRDPIADQHYRSFTFHFRPNGMTEAQRVSHACKVLGISESQVVATASKQNRLPSLRMGHQERVRKLDRLISDEPLAITGNWFDGVSVEDSLLRTASEFRRLYS